MRRCRTVILTAFHHTEIEQADDLYLLQPLEPEKTPKASVLFKPLAHCEWSSSL